MTRSDAEQVLMNIDDSTKIDQYQEEVFLELGARLHGSCSISNLIHRD
jgi:hypothetical protein